MGKDIFKENDAIKMLFIKVMERALAMVEMVLKSTDTQMQIFRILLGHIITITKSVLT